MERYKRIFKENESSYPQLGQLISNLWSGDVSFEEI
jgi:hypothetical protein